DRDRDGWDLGASVDGVHRVISAPRLAGASTVAVRVLGRARAGPWCARVAEPRGLCSRVERAGPVQVRYAEGQCYDRLGLDPRVAPGVHLVLALGLHGGLLSTSI